jgi:hypothetical protein
MIKQTMVAKTNKRFNHVEAKYRDVKAPSIGAIHQIGVEFEFSKTSRKAAQAQ